MIRLLGKKLSILGSISKIAAEEIVRNSSNAEVRKFYKNSPNYQIHLKFTASRTLESSVKRY